MRLPGTLTLKRRPHMERGWTWWLAPKPFDIVSTGLYVGVLAAFFHNVALGGNPATGWQIALMVCATIVLLVIDRLEYWLYGEETPTRAAAYLLITRMALIELVGWLDHQDLSPFLYLIVPFLACMYFSNVVGYWFAGWVWVLYVVKHLLLDANWLSNPIEEHYLGLFTMGLIFSITIARVVRQEKVSRARAEQLLAEVEESHQQLKAYSEQVAELATTRERNRLARDIHDTLGHYLTVINVQLEKAMVFRDKRPQEADQSVSDAKRLAGEALRDVRRSVSALRTTQEMFAVASAITELVEHVRNEQCAVECSIEGSEEGFSRQGLLALYRVAQEGLTNIQKHSQATHAQLYMQFGECEASLSLRDNGCGFDLTRDQGRESEDREGHYGLRGLQERLELVGGCLRIESEPGAGTRLLASVPKEIGLRYDK